MSVAENAVRFELMPSLFSNSPSIFDCRWHRTSAQTRFVFSNFSLLFPIQHCAFAIARLHARVFRAARSRKPSAREAVEAATKLSQLGPRLLLVGRSSG